MRQCYRRLLAITGRVVGQARRFVAEVASGGKRSADPIGQIALQGHSAYLGTMITRVQQVMRQTRERIS